MEFDTNEALLVFYVFLGKLHFELVEAGVGFHDGGKFIEAFSYADKETLIAPKRQGLHIMLNICVKFA